MSESERIVRSADEHAADAALPRAVGLIAGRPDAGQASPHSQKFRVVTATLVAIAVGAVVVALTILLSGGRAGSPTPWSSWSPSDRGVVGEREIADEVAPFYRATPAAQLVIVTVQNISSSSAAGTQLALRDPTTGTLSAISGTSAIFTLCGLGPNCAIAAGTPSAARLLLLRREALELSLYTFKYVSGIDNVVAILPPGHTTATAQLTRKPPAPGKIATSSTLDAAVVFQRKSLTRFLSQPLRATLPEQLAPSVAQMPTAPEAELVSVLTGQALFRQQLIQSQGGSNVLVLDPLPPQ
jgi:hypothetical protein